MADYDLLIPFVTVTSRGGPHDDQSYTCGWEMGMLDVELERITDRTHSRMIHTVNAEQADLLAMHHGWNMRAEATEVDEWTNATFVKIKETGEPTRRWWKRGRR